MKHGDNLQEEGCLKKVPWRERVNRLPGLPIIPTVLRRRLVLAVALVICLVVLNGVWPGLLGHSPTRWRVTDTSYHFTFCQITHGTNHTVSSGLPAFGWLNRKLIKSGKERMSRDQLYSWRTAEDAKCLSVGFKRDGEILKLNTKNGFSYPVEYRHLDAVIVDARGYTNFLQIPPESSGTVYIPQTKEQMHYWHVPKHITNFHGYELRLSRDGKTLATLRLQ